ncbi:MAG: hypothetical protein J5732_04330 [Bacteroidaceae bacterium]|nr:hypothetical protein [Bacteroidaceae bacterium]
MRKYRTAMLAAIILIGGSCTKNTYSTFCTSHPVLFSFDISEPPFNTAAGMGSFITVRKSGSTLMVVDADGHESRAEMSEEQRQYTLLGLGGLILGTPALDNFECKVFAYDLACPVCDMANMTTSRLRIDGTGTASCRKCGTTFDLNNNGFVISTEKEETRPLYRYVTRTTFSDVIVSNN